MTDKEIDDLNEEIERQLDIIEQENKKREVEYELLRETKANSD